MLNAIECWGIFEISLQGPSNGNPFLDTSLSAEFTMDDKRIAVEGFYDGEGNYKIRFMPQIQGKWTYKTFSNQEQLNGCVGEFVCTPPSSGNHGPVRVHNQYHFAYEDQTPYFPFGTTCYAWIHQARKIQDDTLDTLSKNSFNKLRMCVFPKYYANNSVEPELYPYVGTAPSDWDFTRFNPEFFRHLDDRLQALMNLGIEADVILFHPYDKGHWGFDTMNTESDERYLHYLIARIGAYRNVWWSMANEYDYMTTKTKDDWDRYIKTVAQLDPYHHLLSIHQAEILYDHWNPYITHASIQIGTPDDSFKVGMGRYRLLRDAYHKPVIYDEVGYEGNLIQRWGKLTAQELTDKFWQAITSGVYMTHGETFTHPEEIIWWAKGGKLRGKCPARIAFLKSIVEESHLDGLEPLDHWWILNGVGKNGDYYLFYFSYATLTEWRFELPAFKIEVPMGTQFQVDIIDTWNMTITPVKETYEITDKSRYTYTCSYNPSVELPGKPYMAIRIRKVKES